MIKEKSEWKIEQLLKKSDRQKKDFITKYLAWWIDYDSEFNS